MAVVLDVVGDLLPCVVDGFPLGAPGEAFLELAEPGFDERLRFGVTVAAAAVGDAAGVEVSAESREVN